MEFFLFPTARISLRGNYFCQSNAQTTYVRMTEEFTVAAVTVLSVLLIGRGGGGALLGAAVVHGVVLVVVVVVAVASRLAARRRADAHVVVGAAHSRRAVVEGVGHGSAQ